MDHWNVYSNKELIRYLGEYENTIEKIAEELAKGDKDSANRILVGNVVRLKGSSRITLDGYADRWVLRNARRLDMWLIEGWADIKRRRKIRKERRQRRREQRKLGKKKTLI